jgi:hypothetical protein
MKFDMIIQWVRFRAYLKQFPSAQSLTSRAVEHLTCKTSNGGSKLRETRIQAASLSPEIGIVVVTSDNPFVILNGESRRR